MAKFGGSGRGRRGKQGVRKQQGAQGKPKQQRKPKQLKLPFDKPAIKEIRAQTVAWLARGERVWVGYVSRGGRVETLVEGVAKKLQKGVKLTGLSVHERAALEALVELRATTTPNPFADKRATTPMTEDKRIYHKYLTPLLKAQKSKK